YEMIDVKELRFTYAGADELALKGLSFAIQRGEIFGLLGPSGAGKSTTQKILIGLLEGYCGDVQLLGRNLKAWRSDLYERVGVAFEVPALYLKLTALENLSYVRALYHGQTEEPRELLAMVGLGRDGDLRVSQFSKGMRQRLNVARALLHRPELLFLDEPTAGLDPVNARSMKELIRRKREQGTTVFLTTHDMVVADELCDRVAFLLDGEIALIDAPRALKLRYGTRQVQVEYGAGGNVRRRLYALDGLGENEEFLQLLRGEHVQTIHTQETTLETIFIAVTGRSLA
ncbi:MAG TPA: ABC transporter ATP-binding protein, partial [Ardenticatenaceae bacterium]|nr:ABC transporter ATP-binding protein [Ardenticatenaceae bacterium]